jgi:DNA-binding HxlR family transcriptional regulator
MKTSHVRSAPSRAGGHRAGVLPADPRGPRVRSGAASSRHGVSELAESPEGIPTNLLADRLKRLQNAGVVVASRYQERPPRYAYALSDKGRELSAILNAFVQWGKKHIPGTRAMAGGTKG